MKTTIADKVAIGCVIAVAWATVGGWVYAFTAEQQLKQLLPRTYAQPSPNHDQAIAADCGAQSGEESVARGK